MGNHDDMGNHNDYSDQVILLVIYKVATSFQQIGKMGHCLKSELVSGLTKGKINLQSQC